MTIDIGILGADGRMGAAVIRAIAENPAAKLTAALTAPNSSEIGLDAGTLAGLAPLGIAISDNLQAAVDTCDVLIDFSAPTASLAAALAVANPMTQCSAMVSGTTGFSDTENAEFDAMGEKLTLLRSGNFSPGVTALSALVELATEKLGRGWDIEILEMHHRHKVDAPSGTALLLGEAAAKGRGLDLSEARVLSREGVTGARKDDDIGFAALRGGGVIGRHDVRLASSLEMITLSHDAFDRSVFAKGALSSALWLAGKPKGLYSMRDVLGF